MKTLKTLFLGSLFLIMSYGISNADVNEVEACPPWICDDLELKYYMECEQSNNSCHWPAWIYFWNNCDPQKEYPCIS